MLSSQNQDQLSRGLEAVAKNLDISDELHEDAILKYESVGEWLAAEDSKLAAYSPEIYAQGSFRLGTMVRPYGKTSQFDIDLVCHLNIDKNSITQEKLKNNVGDRLKLADEFKSLLTESRRCWVLDWTNLFHMDVLPTIPNIETPPSGILITDTELVRWQKSNPKKYADWFHERMRIRLNETRANLAKSLSANIEDVPEWTVKTPLQRAVQLLKRHRDVYFKGSLNNRPASIILTTLAAHAYNNESDLADTVASVVNGMKSHIEYKVGKYYVMNPAEDGENFAEKWNEDSARRDAFFGWMKKVETDFALLSRQKLELLKSDSEFLPALAKSSVGQTFQLFENQQAAGVAAVPLLGEIKHRRELQWPERRQFTVRIKGGVYLKNKGKKKLWDLSSRAVPKHLHLKFEAITDAPKPYEIQWQVTNTGPYAKEPRGDFIPSSERGSSIHWESTLYPGTHLIEAMVIKNGVCVGRSGPQQVKIRG